MRLLLDLVVVVSLLQQDQEGCANTGSIGSINERGDHRWPPIVCRDVSVKERIVFPLLCLKIRRD